MPTILEPDVLQCNLDDDGMLFLLFEIFISHPHQ